MIIIKKTTVSAAPALERGLNILELLAESDMPVTAKVLSLNLDIPVASTYRLIQTLIDKGYVFQQGDSYALSDKLALFTKKHGLYTLLKQLAVPEMRNLSILTSQTSQLAVLTDKSVVYIEQILPTSPVTIIAPLNVGISVNISAAGKAILAFQSEERLYALLENIIYEKRTPASITVACTFEKELQNIRNLGYALDYEEFARGIGCLAAPIFNQNGECSAAVGITGNIADYDEPYLSRNAQAVMDTAARITSLLGGKGVTMFDPHNTIGST